MKIGKLDIQHAVILASAMLLRHIGELSAANKVEKAVAEVIKEGKSVTKDLNPEKPVDTNTMTEAIIKKLA